MEKQMELIVDPPRFGPFEIGMPFDQAQEKLRSISGYVPPDPNPGFTPTGFAHYESEMSISVGTDRAGNLKEIEVYRPERGVDVLFREISLFETPADEVVRQISSLVHVDIEEDGLLVVAPELLLSLGRRFIPEGPQDEEGWYFESLLVADPGYYGNIYGVSAEPFQ
ncbi:hypothetical protein HNR06_001629 [Nocardiopsis arvandica]|uniref:Uncharacterized protein n=1 Tax=Nocardiopsis sinuspersici TaxID=501010 RepID=A0A7Y9XCY0_9ACTN|nr:hypothetical protein [Nocardiopsis sinuspersici]NYH52040.1 hypothetical protein [Nocardiopsis sinuspersici]